MELELRNGETSEEEKPGTGLVVGPYQVPGGPGVLEGLNEDGGGDSNPVKERELGIKDLFSKELWLITTVLWLVWPIGELAPLSVETIPNQRKCYFLQIYHDHSYESLEVQQASILLASSLGSLVLQGSLILLSSIV